MGLFLRQDENRSELQSKIIADLQEKARTKAATEGEPGEPAEPTMLENQHETRTAGVVISLLVIALIIVIIFVATRGR